MNLLPLELLVNIAKFLPLREKFRLLQVSERFNCAVKLSLKNSDVDVSYSRINDEQLKLFSEVKSINFEGCNNIHMEGFRYLSKVRKIIPRYNIEDIDLYYFQLATEIVLGSCCNVTDDGLEYLSGVEVIDLSFLNITDKGLIYLKKVKKIDLSGCEFITDKGLSCLVNLEDLTIRRNEYITSKGFKPLKNLKKITIADCPRVDKNIFACSKKLKYAFVSNYKYFQSIYGIMPSIAFDKYANFYHDIGIEQIYCNNCDWIDYELICRLSSLIKITLIKCHSLTNKEIGLILALKHIKCVHVIQCKNVTADIKNYIVDNNEWVLTHKRPLDLLFCKR